MNEIIDKSKLNKEYKSIIMSYTTLKKRIEVEKDSDRIQLLNQKKEHIKKILDKYKNKGENHE